MNGVTRWPFQRPASASAHAPSFHTAEIVWGHGHCCLAPVTVRRTADMSAVLQAKSPADMTMDLFHVTIRLQHIACNVHQCLKGHFDVCVTRKTAKDGLNWALCAKLGRRRLSVHEDQALKEVKEMHSTAATHLFPKLFDRICSTAIVVHRYSMHMR